MSLLDTASLIVTPNAYKEGKLYSVIPSDGSGDLSVTRATTATRVNSAGLVELVPYNLLTYSEQFDNADWLKQQASVTANTTTAPNGTLTADTITDDSTLDRHITYQSLNGERSLTRTLSTYAKQGTLRYLALSVTIGNDSTACYSAIFDLQTGTITATKNNGSATINASIENAGNGWYRCVISGALGSGFEAIYPVIATSDRAGFTGTLSSNNLPVYSGSGQTIYLWGAQLVEGSTALDYFATETRLNIPRLDYSNGSCPSLLVEPQRTNLALRSQEFDNLTWTMFNGSVLANQTIAPDGTNAADKVTMGGAGSATLRQTISGVSNGTVVTFSLYIKQGSGVTAFLDVSDTKSIVDITPTNQWIRYTYSVAFNSSAPFIDIELRGTSGSAFCYIWGAQVEVGSYPTSYIPTTSASVTRNADVISKTGISSLIGTEFTLFFDGFETTGGVSTRYIVLKGSGGTYANAVLLEANASNQIVLTILNSSSATVFGAFSPILTSGQRFKLAVRCKNNDFAFYVNGSQVATQASGSVPTTSDLYLGYYTDYADNYNEINATAIWKQGLTNAQLAQLTTI